MQVGDAIYRQLKRTGGVGLHVLNDGVANPLAAKRQKKLLCSAEFLLQATPVIYRSSFPLYFVGLLVRVPAF